MHDKITSDKKGINKMETDEELYKDAIEKFEVVESMIDDEFSRRDETAPLIEAITRLYKRIQELRNVSSF